MAPRRKITKVGGNLPLVAQFRVLRRPSLLTTRHSFLFLFPFPLLLFFFLFFLLFSSFLPFSFPFLLPPPFLRIVCNLFILLAPSMQVDTWLSMCLVKTCKWTHGLPCVTPKAYHVSPDTRCLKIREIPTISKSNEIG